ncbi:MAG: hypothetical protein H6906_06040 [Hyphomicrobiales bacterium]|nr:hypothetical protein [Hyphomicrobiales bacterium]
MSRDPNQVAGQQGAAAARPSARLGLIDEYIADLPYKSKVLNIDEDLWLSWSVGEQEAFVQEIDSKIKLYTTYHDDRDRWVALDGGRIPGDAVYPVPLDALPCRFAERHSATAGVLPPTGRRSSRRTRDKLADGRPSAEPRGSPPPLTPRRGTRPMGA